MVDTHAEPVSAEILSGDYQLVLDCSDNLAARSLLNHHCRARRLPLISASATGWEGQLMAFDFEREQSPCFNCSIDPSSPEGRADCDTQGVVGPVLGVIGSQQATMAMAMLLGYGHPHGQLQRYDGKAGQWMNFKLQANPNCDLCAPFRRC